MTASPTHHLLSTRHKRAIAASLLVAAGLYLGVVFYHGYEKILDSIARIEPGIWLLLLGGSFCSYLLRFTRWQYYLRCRGYRLPLPVHFVYYLAGFALTTTPGKTGEIIRSVLLRPHGVPYKQSIATFFTERFLDVIVITLMSSLAILAFRNFTGLVIMVTVVVLTLLPLLRHRRLHSRLRWWQQTLKPSRFRHALWHLLSLLRRARDLLAPRFLYLGLAIGVVAWSVQGFAFSALLHSMGVNVTFYIAFGIYATSLFVGAVSFIPGGIGSTEAAMYVLLKSVGTDEITAVTIPMVSRLATLWFAVSLGLISTTYLSVRRDRKTTAI